METLEIIGNAVLFRPVQAIALVVFAYHAVATLVRERSARTLAVPVERGLSSTRWASR